MDSAKYVTQHKSIYINIGIEKIMCNKMKCAIQYTVDLTNNNINMDLSPTLLPAHYLNKGIQHQK